MAYMYISWLLLTQMLLQVAKHEAKIPAIIVFGDSTVDTGNNNQIPTLLRSNFKPYGRDLDGGRPTGRFSNGRLPSDFISEALGIKPLVPAYLDPKYGISDFATGVCFASAGTGYDNATSDVVNVIPLWKEMEYYKEYQKRLKAYLGNEKANKILTEALYLLSLGTNDFLENYYMTPRRQMEFTVQQYEDFLVHLSEQFLREIYSLGARKIAVAGLPPMGCLPLVRAINFMAPHQCNEEYNKVALEFNGKLGNMVAKLNQELHGLTVLYKDIYQMFYQLIDNPSSFGFEHVGVTCCGTGMYEMGYTCNELNPSSTCRDPNKYIFWDAFHPTAKTNKILVDKLIADLPQNLIH